MEDVVLGGVENLRVVTAPLLNADGDIVRDRMGEDDLALRTWEEEGVEDLLSRCSDISSSHRVSGGVRVRVHLEGAAHEAWSRLPLMRVGVAGARLVGTNASSRRVVDGCTSGVLAEKGRHLGILIPLFLGRKL